MAYRPQMAGSSIGSLMRFARLASSALSGGVFSALTAVLAVLLLAPVQYGLFSIVYLIFAFGVSLQYSIVSEAWARTRHANLGESSWASYSGALIALSAFVALGAAVPSLVIPELQSAAPFLISAVFFALYRNGARYYSVSVGAIRRVVIADWVGTLAFAVSLAAGWSLADVPKIAFSWLSSVLLSSVLLKVPSIQRGSGLLSWVRSHRASIRPLLSDSLVMDLGAIGTPFLLAGLIGAGPFGTYRAVSNAALPVRLLIDPLRPILGSIDHRVLSGRKSVLLLGLGAATLAIGCFAALDVVIPNLGFRVGTLSSLVPFAIPTSFFVVGSFLGTFFYIVCRTRATPRGILVGRSSQTILVVLAPIIGYTLYGLAGAIWGFSISSALSAMIWVAVLFQIRQKNRLSSQFKGGL
jgi:hypothetical protein